MMLPNIYTRGSMKSKTKKNLLIRDLSQTIIAKVVNELFEAGCSFPLIQRYTHVSVEKAKELLNAQNRRFYEDSECINASPYPQNQALIDKILFDNEDNLSRDVLIETERARFHQYKLIETKCIDLMHKLLDFYTNEPVGVNINKDRFKASLASEFIKATHSARAELIEKYRIEKDSLKAENESRIQVEFIDSTDAVDAVVSNSQDNADIANE